MFDCHGTRSCQNVKVLHLKDFTTELTSMLTPQYHFTFGFLNITRLNAVDFRKITQVFIPDFLENYNVLSPKMSMLTPCFYVTILLCCDNCFKNPP